MSPIAGRVVVVMLSAALASLACTAAEEKALVQVKKPVGAASTENANAELAEAVRATLDRDAPLKAAKLHVDADVTRNQVTLSGIVSSDALRRKAVELAKSAQVGVVVSDRIIVKPNASNLVPPSRRTGFV